MIVAGIDYSMTSPAMCVFDTGDNNDGTDYFKSFTFSDCNFYFLTSLKKYDVKIKNITGKYFQHENMSSAERYDAISNFFIDKLIENNRKCEVFIEGYSMGSKGKVFNIAENTGILKHKLWLFDINFTEVPPTVIKKYATGKGNANKERMQEVFEEHNDIRLKDELHMTEKQWNPSSDLIDAYWICKYGVDGLTTQTK
jgi:Holliday junction resolvasome RuvABC endonuclease subunit